DLQRRIRSFADAELPRLDLTYVVEVGEPGAMVLECAGASHADLIAMPTHGYDIFRRILLGSVTAKVLHDAKIPVWTDAHAPEASHRAHPQPRHIVCALDLKPESRRTLEFSIEL